jgi:hypothetical protein
MMHGSPGYDGPPGEIILLPVNLATSGTAFAAHDRAARRALCKRAREIISETHERRSRLDSAEA